MITLQLTTFGGRAINVDDPEEGWKLTKYLPIHPREPLVPGGIQLHLANGVQLWKASYLNISQVYTVHISMLRSYDWDFPADRFRLSRPSLAIVLRIIPQPHTGLTIRPQITSTIVSPAAVPMFQQDHVSSSNLAARQTAVIDIYSLNEQSRGSFPERPPTYREATTPLRVPSDHAPLLAQHHIRGLYQTTPHYNQYYHSVIHTYARSDPSSQNVLGILGNIAHGISLKIFNLLKTTLQFICRNCGLIIFLFAAGAAGIGTVFGTIWLINTLHRGLGAVGRWITSEWRLLLEIGGKTTATVAGSFHAALRAVGHGWHAAVDWLPATIEALWRGNES